MAEDKNSLYNRIIRAENNSAVIQNILLVDICPFLTRLVKALIYNDNLKCISEKEQLRLWEINKIYLEDIANLRKNPPTRSENVLFDEKIEKFASGRPINQLKQQGIAEKTKWLPFDYDDIDVAAFVKIFNYRIDDPITINTNFEKFLSVRTGLLFYRNKYGGHPTANVRKNCSAADVIKAIDAIKKPVDDLIKDMNKMMVCSTPKKNQEALEIFDEMSKFLKNIATTIKRICNCTIKKNNEKLYDAKTLYPYYVFLAYPNAKSDKYRRFCNDVLRTDHARGDKPIFVDEGTISYLKNLSMSKEQEIGAEAKKTCKELFEPMQREGTLKVLRLSEKEQPVGYIDLNSTNKVETLLENLRKVEGNICVITDDIELADEIWKFNSNEEIKNCSAVAMRVYNKEKVVPFYK